MRHSRREPIDRCVEVGKYFLQSVLAIISPLFWKTAAAVIATNGSKQKVWLCRIARTKGYRIDARVGWLIFAAGGRQTLDFAEKVGHACIKRIVIAMCRPSQHGRSLCLKLKERVANVTFAAQFLGCILASLATNRAVTVTDTHGVPNLGV